MVGRAPQSAVQLFSPLLGRHHPTDSGENLVPTLLDSALVVADIWLALTDQRWHMLGAEVDLDEPALLQLTNVETDKQVGTQNALTTKATKSPPATRFGLELSDLVCALPSAGDEIDGQLRDGQCVRGEVC